MKLITIIVPVYNTKEYLNKCVNSLISQTYENLEIILVDDGSTDASGALCDELAAKDSRIVVIHKENGGSSSARNAGISMAHGDYIGFVDSDDYVEPFMYERLIEGAPAEIIQIGRNEIDVEGSILPDICIPPKEDTFYDSESFMRELLLHKGDCSFCTKIISKKMFDNPKNRFPEGILNEDFYLLVNLLTEIKGVLSKPGYAYHVFYRLGSNSRKEDKNTFSRVYLDSVDNADMVEGIVKKSFPGLIKISMRFGLYQRLEYLLHIPVSQMNKDNVQYKNIVKYLRKHVTETITNNYLTGKNRIYLLLLTVAPKGVRIIHKKLKGL